MDYVALNESPMKIPAVDPLHKYRDTPQNHFHIQRKRMLKATYYHRTVVDSIRGQDRALYFTRTLLDVKQQSAPAAATLYAIGERQLGHVCD